MNESSISIYQGLSIKGGQVVKLLVALWEFQCTDQSFEAMMVVSPCNSPHQVETGQRKPLQIRGLPIFFLLNGKVGTKLAGVCLADVYLKLGA